MWSTEYETRDIMKLKLGIAISAFGVAMMVPLCVYAGEKGKANEPPKSDKDEKAEDIGGIASPKGEEKKPELEKEPVKPKADEAKSEGNDKDGKKEKPEDKEKQEYKQKPADAVKPEGAIDGKDLLKVIQDLVRQIAHRYEPLKSGMLDRCAVMEFDENGSSAREKKLGKIVSELVGSRLVQNHAIRLVERARIDELKKEVTFSNSAAANPQTAQKVGAFLGAQAIVVGSVSEAGADYIINARLVSVKTGEILLSADATVRREGLVAFAEEAVEVKSRVGAIYRAFLPGWAQFYMGPEHHWKGYTISGGCLSSGATAVAMYFMYSGKMNEKKEWDTGSDNCNSACKDAADPEVCMQKVCGDKVKGLASEADKLKYAMIGAASTFGALYLWGFLDAAINAKDYDRVRVSLMPLPPTDGGRMGMVGSLSMEW